MENEVTTQINRLDSLVKTFEDLAVSPYKKWSIPSYNRVQCRFTSEVQAADVDATKVKQVVEQAIQQMEALIEMVSAKEHKKVLNNVFNEENTGDVMSPVVSDDDGFVTPPPQPSLFPIHYAKCNENVTSPSHFYLHPQDMKLKKKIFATQMKRKWESSTLLCVFYQ